MNYEVTKEDIDAYDADGAVLLKNVIGPSQLASVSEAIERDIENPGPFCHSYAADNGHGRFHGNLKIWEPTKGSVTSAFIRLYLRSQRAFSRRSASTCCMTNCS